MNEYYGRASLAQASQSATKLLLPPFLAGCAITQTRRSRCP
jgi:hypothetical protein